MYGGGGGVLLHTFVQVYFYICIFFTYIFFQGLRVLLHACSYGLAYGIALVILLV